ncbi:MAG: hypothetical protein R3E58_05070 [Phycisphaerae bacterium]
MNSFSLIGSSRAAPHRSKQLVVLIDAGLHRTLEKLGNGWVVAFKVGRKTNQFPFSLFGRWRGKLTGFVVGITFLATGRGDHHKQARQCDSQSHAQCAAAGVCRHGKISVDVSWMDRSRVAVGVGGAS